MRCLLLILFFFIYQEHHAQRAFLFVKKGGKKVRTFYEGDKIKMKVGQDILQGYIATLKNDSVYINRMSFHQKQIKTIYLDRPKRQGITGKQVAFVTAGIALSTFGMTVSRQETFGSALQNSAIIGMAPLAFTEGRRHIDLRRKKYNIRKKFTVQVLDFYLPAQRR